MGNLSQRKLCAIHGKSGEMVRNQEVREMQTASQLVHILLLLSPFPICFWLQPKEPDIVLLLPSDSPSHSAT